MSNTKRIQLRLSEPLRAKLAFHFRNEGHRSWDEFFSALMDRWTGNPSPSSSSSSETQFAALDSRLIHIESQLDLCRAHNNNQSEIFQVFQTSQEQLVSQTERFIDLLELGFSLEDQTSSQPREVPLTSPTGSEVLRKFRARQS